MLHCSNSGQKRYFNSRNYNKLKQELSERQKINMLGEKNHFYGKKHTAETRLLMKIAKKITPTISWNTGLTTETSEQLAIICKNISKSLIGLRHWTNGVIDIKSKECPEDGFYIGRKSNDNYKMTDERKASLKLKRGNGNSSWWNNGVNNKRCKECPGEQWERGRLMSASLYAKFCKKV